MNASLTAAFVFGIMAAAVILGRVLRRVIPDDHLVPETKDAVKLAMGVVATMAALLLGLLVNSAKGTYDNERSEVFQIAAKVAFLNRVLELYGPEATPVRAQLHSAVEDATIQIWLQGESRQGQFFSNSKSGKAMNDGLQHLAPQNDEQRGFKAQAIALTFELGQLRSLVLAQSASSILTPMLIVVIGWFVLIYSCFSVISPPNGTVTIALMISALTVSGAIFLILELDQPFSGLMQISSEPILNAVSQTGK